MPITVGQDSARARKTLTVKGTSFAYYSIPEAEAQGLGAFSRLPAALKVVLENMLRFEDGKTVTLDDIKAFGDWVQNGGKSTREIAYRPARVLMQDFTGVPAVVDLAAMRDGIKALGGDAQQINPLAPVDLVIDHSVMIDEFGNPRAFQMNVDGNTNATWSATNSSNGAKVPSIIFALCPPELASAIRSIWSISPKPSEPTQTKTAQKSPTLIRSWERTRIRR